MSILLVRRYMLAAMVGMILTAGAATSASAAGGATKGTLFFNGGTIHTVVVPAALPNGGVDPFYKVTNGAAGQLGIAAVAPGSGDYHGGAWAVNLVTFKSGKAPYLLTSAQSVLAAQEKGDLTVVRRPDLDFRCPVQP
jgi:hypothetical protein